MADLSERLLRKAAYLDSTMLAKHVDTAALLREAATMLETAFKAGYHCRWHREQGVYYFDPAMSPGDPDGAYAAWLQQQEMKRKQR